MDCHLEKCLWHPSFPDWLYGRLEEMGFDGSVYSHYIMSILKQPTAVSWETLAKSKSSVDFYPPKAILFECLMNSDVERDIVSVLVDDIIGKYVQWCHCKEEDKARNNGKDNCRISFNFDNDEAFPPLYRDGPSGVKRYVVQKNGEDVGRSEVPFADQLNRENGTTPKKRMKLNDAEELCNEAAFVEKEGTEWRESCLNLDQDDVGDLLDEISRVALAFNSPIPNSSYFRAEPIVYDESHALWNEALASRQRSNVRDNAWTSWNRSDQSRGSDANYGHMANDPQHFLLKERSAERQREVSDASAFTNGSTVGRRLLFDNAKTSSYGRNDGNPWQQQQWMFRIRRRIPTGPVDIPFSDNTHFVPIRSESMHSAYFPSTTLERQFEDACGWNETTMSDVEEYFVYHEEEGDGDEDDEEEEKDCVDGRLKNWNAVKSLTLRFRAVKFDKCSQTEWCPSYGRFASSAIANGSITNGSPMQSPVTDNDQRSARNHDADKEADEACIGEVWQYQDEKDDEMLIRYVSSISLINPLDLSSSSVGGAYS